MEGPGTDNRPLSDYFDESAFMGSFFFVPIVVPVSVSGFSVYEFDTSK